MIKLIATDIDGTLVKDGSNKIDSEYYSVITALIRKGIKICACSGRQFQSMQRLFHPIAEELYYITENGTLLRTHNRILHTWPIPGEYFSSLLQEVRQIPGTSIVACTSKRSYVDAGEDSEVYHVLKDSYRYDIRNIPDLAALSGESILKVSVFHPTACEEVCHDFLQSHWAQDLQITCSGIQWIDCCAKNAGKGEAFALLQVYLDIPQEETVYFGDNMNDLSAFKEAGISATVANARSEVQEQADVIERSYSDLGVLRAMKRILQGKGIEEDKN